MGLSKFKEIRRAARGAAPIVAGSGAVGGFVSDVIKPVFALAPTLLALFAISSALLYIFYIRRNIKRQGAEATFNSKPGTFFIFSSGSTLVFCLVTLCYFISPPTGFAASEFDVVKQLQQQILGVKNQAENIETHTEKILSKVQNLREQIAALSANAGIISNPQNDADFYHNAKFAELSGNMGLARSSYESFINLQPSYLDAHEAYQSILNNTQGATYTHEVYQKYLQQFAKNPSVELMYGKSLPTRTEKIQYLFGITKKYPDYAPVYLELVLAIIEPGYGALAPVASAEYALALARFYYLDQVKGDFKTFYLDISRLEQKRAKVAEAWQMWNNFGSMYQNEAILKKVDFLKSHDEAVVLDLESMLKLK